MCWIVTRIRREDRKKLWRSKNRRVQGAVYIVNQLILEESTNHMDQSTYTFYSRLGLPTESWSFRILLELNLVV